MSAQDPPSVGESFASNFNVERTPAVSRVLAHCSAPWTNKWLTAMYFADVQLRTLDQEAAHAGACTFKADKVLLSIPLEHGWYLEKSAFWPDTLSKKVATCL